MSSGISRWPVLMSLALLGPAAAATAQGQPQMAAVIVNDRTVTETNGGAVLVKLFLSIVDPSKLYAQSSWPSRSVTVLLSTTGGTATAGTSCGGAGVDYVSVNGLTLTIDSAHKSVDFSITVCGDSQDEPDETFLINLSNATGALIQDPQAQVTLTDDDPPPALQVNDVTVTEGAAGAVSNAVFTVALTGSRQNAVSVSYTVTNRSATAGSCGTANADYATTSGALTFAPNQPTQTLTIPVCGDGVREGNEQFEVRFTGATNVTIQDGTGLGSITDDEPLPTLSILTEVQRSEPGKGGQLTVLATFPVTLAGPPTAQTVLVSFATAPGTATAGACLASAGLQTGDYVTQTGTLSFAPGVTTQEIRVPICGDSASDPNETFTVTLSNPVNATIAQGVGVGTIR
jgi:hypothetical protein